MPTRDEYFAWARTNIELGIDYNIENTNDFVLHLWLGRRMGIYYSTNDSFVVPE